MSLQRIFNVARRLGTPVIMTDADGREPLVVLPLDQFEAMAGVSTDNFEALPAASFDIPAALPMNGKKPQNKGNNMHNPLEKGENAASLGDIENLPLEERFYLEPLESEEGTQG